MADPRYYTIGDSLYIGEIASGTNLPALPWTSATAAINLRQKGGATVLDHAVVTLDVNTGGCVYNGATTVITEAADYEYEIEITFQDGSKQTFPKKEKILLTAIKQIA